MGFGDFVKRGVNKGLNLASHVPGARTVGAGISGGIGAITPAVGPLQGFRDAAFSVSHNALNPNVNVYGQANPGKQSGGGGGGGGSTVPLANPSGVLGASTGLYADGGGSGEASDPNLDPGRIAQLRGEVGGMLGMFQRAYEDVLGKVDELARSRGADLSKAYAGQRETVTNSYGDTSQQINNALSARGALNSSYQANEQGTAKKAYEDAMRGIAEAEASDQADIGQFADVQKAQLGAARPNVNVNDYNTVSDLLSVKQAVDQAVGQLGVTSAGLGTNSQYVNSLNSIVPPTETGSTALKAQLDRLAVTNAAPEAKLAIASQAITDSGADPSQWLDYFQRMMQTPQTPATV